MAGARAAEPARAVHRVGVFGGTFDPPHVGHLIVAQDLVERLELDRLLLIPAGDPPHKPYRPIAPAETRARMLEAAAAGNGRIEVSRIELERSGPSYTVDTLRGLGAAGGEAELHLVIGVDQLREFATWKEPREVARLARLWVVARDGRRPEEVAPDPGVSYETVEVTRIDVSSSDVRRRLREGRPVRHRVPDAVLRIIEEEALYR